jgi:hypothetical protein
VTAQVEAGARRRALARWAAVAGVLLATSGLAGCGGGEDETYLPALLHDPMADWAPAGIGEPVETHRTPYSSGGPFSGKPRQAEVQRVFDLPDAAAATAAAEEGRSAATAADWEDESVSGLFRKALAGSTAHLSVLPNSADPRELVVVLTVTP